MANAWRISATSIGFNLDQSEEVMFLNAYLLAKGASKTLESWIHEFEAIFFEQGKGVSDKVIANVNAILERTGKYALRFEPRISARTQYILTRGTAKCEARKGIVEVLGEPKLAGRILVQAKEEYKSLPLPIEYELEEQEELFADWRRRTAGAANPVEGNPGNRPTPRLRDPEFLQRLARNNSPVLEQLGETTAATSAAPRQAAERSVPFAELLPDIKPLKNSAAAAERISPAPVQTEDHPRVNPVRAQQAAIPQAPETPRVREPATVRAPAPVRQPVQPTEASFVREPEPLRDPIPAREPAQVRDAALVRDTASVKEEPVAPPSAPTEQKTDDRPHQTARGATPTAFHASPEPQGPARHQPATRDVPPMEEAAPTARQTPAKPQPASPGHGSSANSTAQPQIPGTGEQPRIPGFGDQPDLGAAFPFPRDPQFDRKFPEGAPSNLHVKPRHPPTPLDVLLRIEEKLDALLRVEAKLDELLNLKRAEMGGGSVREKESPTGQGNHVHMRRAGHSSGRL